jgi:hypothetical protein
MNMAAIGDLPAQVNAEISARGQFDQAAQDQRIALMGQSAPQLAAQALQVSQTFGPAFIAQQRAAANLIDPNAVALRDAIGSQVLGELAKGRDLTSQQQTNALNDIRGAQVARGNTEGSGALLDEALNMGSVRERMFQQRLQNAAGYFGLPRTQDITQGLQTGYAPLPPDSFRLLNQNAGLAGVSAGASDYGAQANMYNTQANIFAQTPNPWVQGLGMVGGVAGGYAATKYGFGAGGNPFGSTPQVGPMDPYQVQRGANMLMGGPTIQNGWMSND